MTPEERERQLRRLQPAWKKDGLGLIPLGANPGAMILNDPRVVRRFNKQDMEPFPPKLEGNSTFPPQYPLNCADLIGKDLNFATSGFAICFCKSGSGFRYKVVAETINTTGVATYDPSGPWTGTVGTFTLNSFGTDETCPGDGIFLEEKTIYLSAYCVAGVLTAIMGTSPLSNDFWFNNTGGGLGEALPNETPGNSDPLCDSGGSEWGFFGGLLTLTL